MKRDTKKTYSTGEFNNENGSPCSLEIRQSNGEGLDVKGNWYMTQRHYLQGWVSSYTPAEFGMLKALFFQMFADELKDTVGELCISAGIDSVLKAAAAHALDQSELAESMAEDSEGRDKEDCLDRKQDFVKLATRLLSVARDASR